jgi:hypothetical protein
MFDISNFVRHVLRAKDDITIVILEPEGREVNRPIRVHATQVCNGRFV